MKLKASSIILLVFAAVLALCAAFVARSLLTSRDAAAAVQQKAEVKEEKVPDVYVVSAAKDIYPGQFISASDMRWEPVKADAVPPAAIEAKTPADREAAASLLGATVRRDVASGEVITRDSLLFSGNPGFISAVLTPRDARCVDSDVRCGEQLRARECRGLGGRDSVSQKRVRRSDGGHEGRRGNRERARGGPQ